MMAHFCVYCGKKLKNDLERICAECYRKRREEGAILLGKLIEKNRLIKDMEKTLKVLGEEAKHG